MKDSAQRKMRLLRKLFAVRQKEFDKASQSVHEVKQQLGKLALMEKKIYRLRNESFSDFDQMNPVLFHPYLDLLSAQSARLHEAIEFLQNSLLKRARELNRAHSDLKRLEKPYKKLSRQVAIRTQKLEALELEEFVSHLSRENSIRK